ncbi:hypothetical protein HK100_011914 [Physocladia obscura]|uniref:SH3 domain-containing protein n=1 Tax=Physocladia obscura TaxID=109957 RepID=A0AAD5XGA2_9FUNG|nr:hypothetical protein HK100_011914 [Physocladia obscura]
MKTTRTRPPQYRGWETAWRLACTGNLLIESVRAIPVPIPGPIPAPRPMPIPLPRPMPVPGDTSGFGGVNQAGGKSTGGDAPSSEVTVTKVYDFFTVTDSGEAGTPCQGNAGLISLYLGAKATLNWNSDIYSSTPVSMSLNLTINSPFTGQPYIVANNVTISATTDSYSFTIPANATLNTSASYSLLGSYFDGTSVVQLPSNTTNVDILTANETCNRQTGSSLPINTPLAIGLGSGVGVLILLLTAVTFFHAKRLQKRDDKGKYWIDGPRSKELAKPNLINATLTKMRRTKKQVKKDSSTDSKTSSLNDENSNDAGSQETSGNVEVDLISDNPFLTEYEMNRQIPLKDELSSSTNNNSDSKFKAGPLLTVRRKNTEKSFAALFRFNSSGNKDDAGQNDDSQKDDDPTSPGFGNFNNNVVRQMVDPVTGQVKSFVMLDSRGPPDRNTGGSSKWAPPIYLLSQRHRVLTAFTPNEPDELTLNRGEIVIVESVFEDGWAIVHKLEDRNKPEATNSSKRGDVIKMMSAPKLSIPVSSESSSSSSPISPVTPRSQSWGTRMLRSLLKDDGSAELLGDAATGGKRGIVPYYCLFLMADFHTSMARKPEQSLPTIV